jgi:hypothetical protein
MTKQNKSTSRVAPWLRTAGLMVLIAVTAHHVEVAFAAALDTEITPENWRVFKELGLCTQKHKETVHTVLENAACALLVGGKAFFGHFVTNTWAGIVAIVTLVELYNHLGELKRNLTSAARWVRNATVVLVDKVKGNGNGPNTP